jgi:hypothetical protein
MPSGSFPIADISKRRTGTGARELILPDESSTDEQTAIHRRHTRVCGKTEHGRTLSENWRFAFSHNPVQILCVGTHRIPWMNGHV